VLALGIVAHTSRATQAKQLARTIRADFISFDSANLLGCDGNHRVVQQHLGALGADWAVIVEDDAEPIPRFREQLAAALEVAPSPIVSAYLGQSRPRQWQRRVKDAIDRANQAGAHWIRGDALLHAVAYCVRTELLAGLLQHQSRLPVDQHATSYARLHGHSVAYTVGSLCDHADGPTLFDHPDGHPRPPGRKAWQLGGHDTWNTCTVTLR
jgi:hypothetical protein